MVSTQSLPSRSLLFVEDDKAACDIIARVSAIEFPDYKILAAENGVMGVTLYKEFTPDIVVTDINMPVMDGIEMARAIRAINAKATFIVLTAYGDKKYLDKFKEIGYCAYLLKPIIFNDLFAAIEACIAGIKV